MKACQDHLAQEVKQRWLHYCKCLKINLAPNNTRQSSKISNCRKNLLHCRDIWSSFNESFWCAQTAISRADTFASVRTNLCSVTRSKDCELDQLQCERSLQWSLQEQIAAKNEDIWYVRRVMPLSESLLFRVHSVNSNQQTVLWNVKAITDWLASRLFSLSDSLSFLQCRLDTAANR